MRISNLTALTAGRYKLILEESWYHERPEVRGPDRSWYELIPCKGGAFIGLYSETPRIIFHLYTPRVKNAWLIWDAIKEKPNAVADFHMDGEAMIYLPAEVVHQVAELAGARKKRRLSTEAKAKLVERMKAYQFQGKNHAVELEKTTQF